MSDFTSCRGLMDQVEKVAGRDGGTLAYIMRAELMPERTTFMTPPDLLQQVGLVVYPAGGEIARHTHVPVERHITGTPEVIVVRKGRCELDVYDEDRALVRTLELRTGDVMLMVGGGHGFRMLEDTVLLEVKQGPYSGIEEKTLF